MRRHWGHLFIRGSQIYSSFIQSVNKANYSLVRYETTLRTSKANVIKIHIHNTTQMPFDIVFQCSEVTTPQLICSSIAYQLRAISTCSRSLYSDGIGWWWKPYRPTLCLTGRQVTNRPPYLTTPFPLFHLIVNSFSIHRSGNQLTCSLWKICAVWGDLKSDCCSKFTHLMVKAAVKGQSANKKAEAEKDLFAEDRERKQACS